ncbi:MAG: hypothetical protein ACRCTI_03365 [Beijerinckiaceae bacterium]
MLTIRRISLAILMAGQMATAAWAGPFTDAEAQMRQAYADYRAALFQTNQKDKAATEAALAAFRARWTALATAWKASPPPQYADDGKLRETLDAVARIASEAQATATLGDLPKSHEILEAIRDQLGALRIRNGVIAFSDRMNAYHEVMEHAVDMPEMTQASALEHAAVLAYLAKDLAANRPAGVDAAAFDAALKALEASVNAFQTAARSGDKAAIDAARKALKPPYSRMFLRFG